MSNHDQQTTNKPTTNKTQATPNNPHASNRHNTIQHLKDISKMTNHNKVKTTIGILLFIILYLLMLYFTIQLFHN